MRRNYVRGSIDKAAFSEQVDRLASEEGLPLDAIYEQMGFEDAEEFSKLYEKEKKREEEAARAAVETSTSASAVRILEDLSTVLSSILAEHGHTVPNSFIVFPAGSKHHMYVAANPALKNSLQAVAEQAVAQGIEINIALAGLLQIGMTQTGFLSGDGGVEVNEAGRQEFDGDSDIEPIPDDSSTDLA